MEAPLITARKIFYEYELFASCSVIGFEQVEDQKLEEKGKLVIEYLTRLDFVENFPSGRNRTKRKFPGNVVGDYQAQKAFRWKRVMVNNEPKYTIWRVQ